MLKNSIIHGDSLDVLPRLPSGSVDLVVTDPPYLVNYRARDGRTIAGDRQPDWLFPAFAEAYRALKQDRFCVSFYGWHLADLFLRAWRAAGFRPVGHIVWVKDYASSAGFLRYQHEQAYLLAKGSPKRGRFPMKDALHWDYTGNIYHPTQKPVSALRPLIGAFSRPGDLVLDPFAGSGSTLVAARQLGRRYLGIEVDQQYWQRARERLENARE